MRQVPSMSESSDNDISLDLQFLPEWAQEDSSKSKYASHSGDDRSRDLRRAGGRKSQNRRGRDDHKNRGADGIKGKGGGHGKRDSRSRREKSNPRDSQGGLRKRDGKVGRFQKSRAPQLGLRVDFVPNEHGVESIAKEIKLTGRAYPLFQIALLILNRPSRYTIKLNSQNKTEEERGQRLFQCKLDGSIWLTEEQCVTHALSSHFEDFYEIKKTETEGPNGNFTYVAKCGVTNRYLGAPNHHDYQNNLVAFHAEHLPRMPFEKFKSRILITKEEEDVNAWLEQCKWKTEFVSVKTDEKATFDRRDEVKAHFESNHVSEVVEEVHCFEISGEEAKSLQEPRQLAEFLKDQWYRQKHYPMQLSTHLSRIFSSLGLQFFKKDKKITHVSVARPSFLDIESEPVSESVRRIMQFIDSIPNCTRRQILEQLGGINPEGLQEREESSVVSENTEENRQIISDLHWLIHQGHVLEFSNGVIETAKRPREKIEANDSKKLRENIRSSTKDLRGEGAVPE